MPFRLEDLAALIAARAAAPADASYTRALLDKGRVRVAQKTGEEAIELVIAATEGAPGPIVAEAADLFYHTLVLLQASGVTLDAVLAELDRRTGRSGHDEKASRASR